MSSIIYANFAFNSVTKAVNYVVSKIGDSCGKFALSCVPLCKKEGFKPCCDIQS